MAGENVSKLSLEQRTAVNERILREFKKFDENENSKISKNEFVNSIIEEHRTTKEQQTFYFNGNPNVRQTVSNGPGFTLTDAFVKAEEQFNKYDVDKKNEIDIDTYEKMVRPAFEQEVREPSVWDADRRGNLRRREIVEVEEAEAQEQKPAADEKADGHPHDYVDADVDIPAKDEIDIGDDKKINFIFRLIR